MMMTISRLNHGVHIPGWAIAAIVLIIAVLTTGFSLGRTWNDTQRSVAEMNTRMCRIERALDIPPWPSCPAVRSER